MPTHDIIVGRDESDLKKFGDEATLVLGRHIVGKGEEAHLTNKIRMDIARPHIGLILGKRGQGKSYTMAVMAEEIASIEESVRKNLSVLLIDTMGIFWSMKHPNEKEIIKLKEWDLKPAGFNINLLIPHGFRDSFDSNSLAYTNTISLRPYELTSEDWALTFQISLIDSLGILLERVIEKLEGKKYTLDDMIETAGKIEYRDEIAKEGLINLLSSAKRWGIFSNEGESINSIIKPGSINVLDVSMLTDTEGGWSVKTLLVGLLSRSIYQKRVTARREEEMKIIEGEDIKRKEPITWLMIDEAHQFLPNDKKTAATDSLLTLVKQGRQPGISCIFATQQPYKLHADAISQADIVFSHRLTAKNDIDSLKNIMQTYLLFDLEKYINELPREKGTAILLDDNSERIYSIKIRPRKSWHAGDTPLAIEKKKEF